MHYEAGGLSHRPVHVLLAVAQIQREAALWFTVLLPTEYNSHLGTLYLDIQYRRLATAYLVESVP